MTYINYLLCSPIITFLYVRCLVYKLSLVPQFFGAIQKKVHICNYFNKFNKYFAWLLCIQNFLDICKFLPNYLNLFDMF